MLKQKNAVHTTAEKLHLRRLKRKQGPSAVRRRERRAAARALAEEQSKLKARVA